jgi:glyoxylase-like metal-dependent hydrolase (beta-lactamase superfamily II)
MSAKTFASTGDLAEKTASFTELGRGLYAFTAEGDPNTGVIVGDECCMVVDAQATPAMAESVVARIREVTDKPVKYVLLSHYHAVRVLGASAFGASEIIASTATRKLIVERGEQDKASEIGRFPRLFRGVDTIPPGLTWPTLTFENSLTLWLGRRRVDIVRPGRGHTAGDTIAWVPDEGVMFSGDLVEHNSACYCGDAHLEDWPKTLDRLAEWQPRALVPGRGAAVIGDAKVRAAMASTREFLNTLFGTASASVAKGRTLRETFHDVRAKMDGPFGRLAIYEHCLPFNVARAYDEARGIEWPAVWTAERDREMWDLLQG